MGRRVAVAATSADVTELQHVTPVTNGVKRSIRKRKRLTHGSTPVKAVRLNGAGTGGAAAAATAGHQHSYNWHENADDEDSSSNDTPHNGGGGGNVRNSSTKHANNSSILLNSSTLNVSFIGGQLHNSPTTINESPKPVYVLRPSIVNGTILYDLAQKPWRLGRPIGKGNFGEIFLASDNITLPVTNENAKYVVKVEPHSNGPLFVEIHCLLNTAKKLSDASVTSKQLAPSGIPDYIASGSHYFGDARYRFLVLQRFDRDLHSIIRNTHINQKSVLTLAVHIIDVLENLHEKGYCHNDVKAQNLMISKCKFYKEKPAKGVGNKAGGGAGKQQHSIKSSKYDEHYEEKQQTTDSGNSSEQEANEEDDDEEFVVKRKQRYTDDDDDEEELDEDDEDFDDGATSHSNNTNSMDMYQTPVNKHSRPRRNVVEFSGSNPVRSCRRDKRNSIYDEMVKSHYLRPTKRVSYAEFYEDVVPIKDTPAAHPMSSDEDSEEFVPKSVRRSIASSKRHQQQAATTPLNAASCKRTTRRQAQQKLKLTSTGCNIRGTQAVSAKQNSELVATEEERIFLIDYGLASKFQDQGVHRPFIMDQRRAHDGTLEFTSRDAHMGAHSRRSDLECLGYNLIYWSQGYLPWKDAAVQQQQEKVHRSKEYLMTDVREMLKLIYGKQVPKYLGEFLHQVGDLAFHDRPDYEGYRQIFKREYELLGYDSEDMRLDSAEILRSCVRVKEDLENKFDIFEVNKHNSLSWSTIKNCSVGTPFQESTHNNSRISPKNLRSKTDKKSLKKKKFSWAEILSQDPDQIARERAEKEFDREEESNDVKQPTVRRYEGKPTYAILAVLRKLRDSGRLIDEEIAAVLDDEERKTKEEADNEANDADYEEEEMDEDDNEEDAEEEEDEENDEDMEVDEDGEDEEAAESASDNEDNELNMTDNEEEDEDDNDDDVEEESSDDEDNDDDKEKYDGNSDETTTSSIARSTRNAAKRRGQTKSSQRDSNKSGGNRSKTSFAAAAATSTAVRKTSQPKPIVRVVPFNTKTRSTANQEQHHNNSTTTNNNNNNSDSNVKSSTAVVESSSNKRGGGATRQTRKVLAAKNNNSHAASAAGEIEQLRRFGNAAAAADETNKPQPEQQPPRQRRTRRCLIKTEKAMRSSVLAEEEDSNSTFSPEMRSLYLNNNESIYFKGSAVAAAAAQHAAATAVANRHFRK